jgi:hypothetical protein
MSTSQLPSHISLRDMFPIRSAHRWGGLAFVVGNLLFVANKLSEMSRVSLAPDVRCDFRAESRADFLRTSGLNHWIHSVLPILRPTSRPGG